MDDLQHNNNDKSHTQNIDGDRNQIAGRDFHIHGDYYTPDHSNPELMKCPGCHYFGIHKTAPVCLKCGFNLDAYWKKLEQDRNSRNALIMVAGIFALALVNKLAETLEIAYGGALMLTAIMAAALYFGIPFLMAMFLDWLDKRKKG